MRAPGPQGKPSRVFTTPYAGQPRSVTATVRGGEKAEQADRRSDALEKRRKLMEAWAVYCEPKGSDNVVQIRKR
jgi:hypothetical protein